MKALSIALLLIGLSACNERKLEIGDCVQKPDSAIVWKIVQKDEKHIIINQNFSDQVEKEIMIDASADSYIKTECL